MDCFDESDEFDCPMETTTANTTTELEEEEEELGWFGSAYDEDAFVDQLEGQEDKGVDYDPGMYLV